MKKLILLLISLNSLALIDGDYQCLQGNNDSICKQRIKAHKEGDEITALKVTYIGYCEGMGYNYFFCHDFKCRSGAQEIEIFTKDEYSWDHTIYDIKCDSFKLIE